MTLTALAISISYAILNYNTLTRLCVGQSEETGLQWVFNPPLNCLCLMEAERRCADSEFQTVEAATWKLHVAVPTFMGYFTVHV